MEGACGGVHAGHGDAGLNGLLDCGQQRRRVELLGVSGRQVLETRLGGVAPRRRAQLRVRAVHHIGVDAGVVPGSHHGADRVGVEEDGRDGDRRLDRRRRRPSPLRQKGLLRLVRLTKRLVRSLDELRVRQRESRSGMAGGWARLGASERCV